MKNIGIDIGMKTCVVCIMDEKKNVLEETAYPNTLKDATEFARRAAKRHGQCRAVCESTGNMWLKSFEGFDGAGIPIVLANPAKLKAISQAGAKTDRIDARMLARLLSADMIPACHVPERDVRSQKQILRHRITLVQDRTRMSNRAGRLLDKYDVAMRGTRLPGAKNLGMLEAERLENENDDYVLHSIIRQIRRVNEEVADIDRRIRAMALENEDARIIMSMTGLDAFGALLVALEIDGIGRFPSPKKLVSWAGLCPTVHQSGNTTYHGRMRKDSNRHVNWIMNQAAKSAARYDKRMSIVYERARKAHPYHVAVSHVSTKMLTIIWHMLHDRKMYDGKKDALYARKLKKLESR